MPDPRTIRRVLDLDTLEEVTESPQRVESAVADDATEREDRLIEAIDRSRYPAGRPPITVRPE